MNRHNPKTPPHHWTNTGNFMNRPQNGWLHREEQLNPDAGVMYIVRFLGSIAVLESMKLLDFNTRTAVAKEGIYRVCSAVCKRRFKKKNKQGNNCLFFPQPSVIEKYLSEELDLTHADTEVIFTVSVDNLSVIREDNANLLYHHRMQLVSFASGGDDEFKDFIVYIAKDDSGRKCYVMECNEGLANDVITTIGQAFELRFKKYLSQRPTLITTPDRLEMSPDEVHSPFSFRQPPVCPNFVSSKIRGPMSPLRSPLKSPASTRLFFDDQEDLIDLSDEVDHPSVFPPRNPERVVSHDRVGSVLYAKPFKQRLGDNMSSPGYQMSSSDSASSTDGISENGNFNSHGVKTTLLPYLEPWFHGKISRQECEKRLLHNGDFLVRESPTSPGQFVLSGRHDGDVKHLLLVDPDGRVRTKDQLFTSVSHLINYHLVNSVPIIAVNVELVLVFPIKRQSEL